jgi:dienelactone hydrolase
MDPILAKPTSACCVTDSSSYHSDDPQSKLQRIGGVETYVSTPDDARSNDNILLFFPDAFGLCAKNYLVMDAFAALGYLVLGVDYFEGVRTESHALKNS